MPTGHAKQQGRRVIARQPKPPSTTTGLSGKARLAAMQFASRNEPVKMGDVLRTWLDEPQRETTLRVYTGITELDTAMGPMMGGEMIVVAAILCVAISIWSHHA